MPSPQYFAQCPPFPADTPVADIPTVKLRGLEDGSASEDKQLFDACRHHGFFLLDLAGSNNGQPLLKHAEKMFDLTAETLNLDRQILDEYAFKPPKDLLGYKKPGIQKTDDGKVDCTEMYTLGQDDMLGTAPARKNPKPVEQHRGECRDFFQSAAVSVSVVLEGLGRQLGLAPGSLTELASIQRASATSLRLLLTRPGSGTPSEKRITLGQHTDIGLITMLFHVAGGLQILPASSENRDENWRHVRPQPGHALINLGDTFVELTGGVLRSGLHRVVTAPGDQNSATRISLAYLVRPARGSSMRRLRGDKIPAADTQDNDRTVDEWAAERAGQILQGVLKPRSTGGIAIAAS